jgi:uncharacterized damage-inducible protein DinB
MINRPQPDEYSDYMGRYINLVGDEPILDILAHQQESTYNLFMQLAKDKAGYTYADGKWTVKEMLGHMIDAERTFAYRILAFSREETELPGFDQDVYMLKATFNDRTLLDLAEEFKFTRQANMYLYRSITDAQSIQKGIASGNPVSVRALLYITAGHVMHHVNILMERYLVGN